MNTHKIIKVGNCSTGNSEGGMVYSPEGVSQTITAGTHGYGMGNIIITDSYDEIGNNEIIILGNYMQSNYDASRIVHIKGIAPCVKENHGTVTAILVNEDE